MWRGICQEVNKSHYNKVIRCKMHNNMKLLNLLEWLSHTFHKLEAKCFTKLVTNNNVASLQFPIYFLSRNQGSMKSMSFFLVKYKWTLITYFRSSSLSPLLQNFFPLLCSALCMCFFQLLWRYCCWYGVCLSSDKSQGWHILHQISQKRRKEVV